jgi:hypothetical protein
VNRKDTPHWEPITHPFGPYHPELALFTAAWLKLFVDKTPFSREKAASGPYECNPINRDNEDLITNENEVRYIIVINLVSEG